MIDGVQRELDRRLEIWDEVNVRGGPDGVEPRLVKQQRIHLGQQGIFRDLRLTAAVTGNASGITVGLLHTGKTYADDLTDEGVIYHYPETDRGNRDDAEVAATKACGELGLPLFVVITPPENPKRRNIRLGWVQDHDDEHGLLLILFSDTQQPPIAIAPVATTLESFALKVPRRGRRQAQVTARPNQTAFRFNLMKVYGVGCAVCDIGYQELLHAAHICPVEQNGSDHPLNGIVFCLNQHRAFDAGLFRIDPETLEVKVKRRYSARDLGLTRASIRHLRQVPHPEALQWAWSARGKGLKDKE